MVSGELGGIARVVCLHHAGRNNKCKISVDSWWFKFLLWCSIWSLVKCNLPLNRALERKGRENVESCKGRERKGKERREKEIN